MVMITMSDGVTTAANEEGLSWWAHWREYLAEALGLAFFLVAVGAFVTLLEHPRSPAHLGMKPPWLGSVLVGLFVGLTLIAIVYSPIGKRSGAHINPALTLVFHVLGRVRRRDAIFYVLAQFAGGTLGLLALSAILGKAFTAPPVRAIVTQPGMKGVAAAFGAETAMAFGMMMLVLLASNDRRLHRHTGLLAGALAAVFIVIATPISGMSINPARSFASALAARSFAFLWIYFTAPPLGMLLAAALYRGVLGRPVLCAKLNHTGRAYCLFDCGYRRLGISPV
jgi:aquaporin Z